MRTVRAPCLPRHIERFLARDGRRHGRGCGDGRMRGDVREEGVCGRVQLSRLLHALHPVVVRHLQRDDAVLWVRIEVSMWGRRGRGEGCRIVVDARLAEGGDASAHRKRYTETVRNCGDLVYKEGDTWIKIVYEKHELVILSGLECRVNCRSRYENVCLIKEGDIASDARKKGTLKTSIMTGKGPKGKAYNNRHLISCLPVPHNDSPFDGQSSMGKGMIMYDGCHVVTADDRNFRQ